MVLVLKQNREFRFLLTQNRRQNCCHGNSTRDVILFLLWRTFMVPSFKNTASIFPEIYRLFSIFHFLKKRLKKISLKPKKILKKEKRHSSVF